jgi:uncharacterized protein YndB with AHSA1/START domain
MASYRFLTTWCLDAPIEPVWDALFASERYAEWWPGVERSDRLREGDRDGVGSVTRSAWRSVLPYVVRFDAETVRVRRPHLIHVRATGELQGTGTWRLYGADDGTCVVYEWTVETTQPWMKALAPVARPVFAWNHDAIMRRGGEGLARLLGCRLVAAG